MNLYVMAYYPITTFPRIVQTDHFFPESCGSTTCTISSSPILDVGAPSISLHLPLTLFRYPFLTLQQVQRLASGSISDYNTHLCRGQGYGNNGEFRQARSC